MRFLPKPTYLPLPLMMAVQALVWVTETQVAADPRVVRAMGALPLGTMWIVVVAFTAGLFVQDLYNPQSWFHRARRASKRVFLIEMANFPHDSTPEVEWVHLRLRLRWLRRIEARLSVRVIDRSSRRERRAYRLNDQALKKALREPDETQDLFLATFPIKAYDDKAPGYNTWTPDVRRDFDPATPRVTLGAEYLIEVEAITRKGSQIERVLFVNPHRDSMSFGRVALVNDDLITILPPEEPKG